MPIANQPTITIGSGPISLVQKGSTAVNAITQANGDVVSITLPAPSTAGTALIAVVCNHTTLLGASVLAFPTGWAKLAGQSESSNNEIEIWAYQNNPGGIQVVSFTVKYLLTGPAQWISHLSEWANVKAASALDASGGTSATSGTTLSPTTSSNILSSGDLAISAWVQVLAAGGPVTFTSPTGFSRLIALETAQINHLDAEYQVGPITGAPLGPVLTSTGTTASAAGVTVALKAAPPVVDVTSQLRVPDGLAMTIKQNTADMTLSQGGRYMLEDGSGFYLLEDGSGYYLQEFYLPQLGDPVTITNPNWSGRVVDVTTRDLDNLITNYLEVDITAINSTPSPGGIPPGDLSDTPVGGYYQLEDGSGNYLTEDGTGYYVQEGTAFAYRNLVIKQSQNQDGAITIYGSLETFESGYQPGMTFKLTSTSRGYNSQPFTITNVTANFLYTTPVYTIEFGDAYQTLQKAGGGVLTQQGSTAAIQQGVAVPAGILGYAEVSVAQSGITTETDVTGLAVTVTVVAGRRIKIKGYVKASSTTTTDGIGLRIRDENSVELRIVDGVGNSTDSQVDLTAERILQPSGGVHTYKLTLERRAGTGTIGTNTTDPLFISVEDIGV